MRFFGMGKQADELVLSMNRAAEAAVPEAKSLLVDAVKEMTLEDAKGILTGGKTSATDFFRKKTEAKLTERFQPIVKATTDKAAEAKAAQMAERASSRRSPAAPIAPRTCRARPAAADPVSDADCDRAGECRPGRRAGGFFHRVSSLRRL